MWITKLRVNGKRAAFAFAESRTRCLPLLLLLRDCCVCVFFWQYPRGAIDDDELSGRREIRARWTSLLLCIVATDSTRDSNLTVFATRDYSSSDFRRFHCVKVVVKRA